MAEYGLVMDVDATKQELKNMNRDYNNRRTWAGLETNLALSAQTANTALTRDYSTAMSEAYNAAKINQRAINASGLIGEGRLRAEQENRSALEQAYSTYMSNYQTAQQSIAENYTEGMTAIDAALTEQAKNTIAYKEKHEDYLDYLWYQYQMGENTLFDNKQWSKFLVDDVDDEGNVITDKKGNALKRLKTREELYSPTFNEYTDDEGNTQKEWTGFVDDEGNLTIAGLDFFDQLSNVVPSEALGSSATFGQFLAQTDTDFLMNQYGYTASEAKKIAEENAEILKWSQTYNPYNYTPQGTNKGSFRTMVGMASTDDTYSFAERFGGMTREQINGLFTEYNDAAEALSKKMKNAKDKGKSITKEVKGLVDSAHNLAIELGIDNDLNINWDQLAAEAELYYSNTKSSGEMTGMFFNAYGSQTISGGAFGASLGALGGSVVPGVGTAVGAGVGTAIGVAVGQVVGVIEGAVAVDEQRTLNKKMAKSSQELFNNMLGTMTAYAAYTKRQRDIDFALQNA